MNSTINSNTLKNNFQHIKQQDDIEIEDFSEKDKKLN
jgi:hypothetical protein